MLAPPAPSTHKRPIATRCLGLVLTTMLWLSTGSVSADPAVLTENEVIDRVLSNPALVEVLDGRTQHARADVARAGRWQNPRVSYTREQLLTGGAAGEDYLSVSQQFDLSGNRWIRRGAARTRVEAQQHRNRADQANVVATVRQAYAHALYAQERLEVLSRWRSRVNQAVTATDARASAGDLSRLEAARLRQELRILDARIASAEGSRRRAWADLRAAIAGEERDDPPTLAGPLLPPTAPTKSEASLAEAPGLRALGAQLEAANEEHRAAQRRWLPPVTLSLGYKGIDEGAGRRTGFTAGASIALPLGDRGQVQRRRAQARASEARGQQTLERARLEARQSELRRRHDVLAAGLSGDGADEELPALAEVAYRGGELGVVGLLDAYRGAYEAYNATLDLALEIRITHIELDRLHGRRQP